MPFRSGRRIPERWTGVINIDQDDLKRINLREIATDLKLAPNLPSLSKRRKERNWAPLFFAQHFVKEHREITLVDFALTDKKLKTLAVEVSKARERFEEAA